MHFPLSNYYVRRVRLPIKSALLKPLVNAGYKVEPAAESPETTVVVEFPVNVGKDLRKAVDVSMWEQLSLAAFLQRVWADNQVSLFLEIYFAKQFTYQFN
jgi:ribonucleoside-triphosphate reductase